MDERQLGTRQWTSYVPVVRSNRIWTSSIVYLESCREFPSFGPPRRVEKTLVQLLSFNFTVCLASYIMISAKETAESTRIEPDTGFSGPDRMRIRLRVQTIYVRPTKQGKTLEQSAVHLPILWFTSRVSNARRRQIIKNLCTKQHN